MSEDHSLDGAADLEGFSHTDSNNSSDTEMEPQESDHHHHTQAQQAWPKHTLPNAGDDDDDDGDNDGGDSSADEEEGGDKDRKMDFLLRAVKDPKHLKTSACTVYVTLLNQQEIELHSDRGHAVTALELKDMVLDALEVPEQHRALFSIWIASPSLQIPAKDYHYPFQAMKMWDVLLDDLYEKGTDFDAELPALWLRKAPTCFPGLETLRNQLDINTCRLLFIELAHQVVTSQCLVGLEDSYEMAAIHLFLNYGATATKDDIKDTFGCEFPPHLKAQTKEKAWAANVFAKYTESSTLWTDWNEHSLMESYLNLGQLYASYGGVAFFGTMPPTAKGTVFRMQKDVAARIVVNFDGLFVHNDDTKTLVLAVPANAYDAKAFTDEEDNPMIVIRYTKLGEPLAQKDLFNYIRSSTSSEAVEETRIGDSDTGMSVSDTLKRNVHLSPQDGEVDPAGKRVQGNETADGGTQDGDSDDTVQELSIWTNQAGMILDSIELYRVLAEKNRSCVRERETCEGRVFTPALSKEEKAGGKVGRRKTMARMYNSIRSGFGLRRSQRY